MNIPLEIPQLDEIIAKLDEALKQRAHHYWWTLDQALALKYGDRDSLGVSWRTLKDDHAYWPLGGIPDDWMSGKPVWRWETVECWLPVTDLGLEAYLKIVNPAIECPARILDIAKRRRAEWGDRRAS